MEYRFSQEQLMEIMAIWNRFLKRKVHLIACGGTALTLQGIKNTTKDVDFMVPVEVEYEYLIKTLKQLGYQSRTGAGWKMPNDPYIFDLYRGKQIHTTELFESPLKEGQHKLIKEWRHLYIGILNHYDLIISKFFRSSSADVEDCLMLYQAKKREIVFDELDRKYKEAASYHEPQSRMLDNWEHFKRLLMKGNLI